MLYSEVTTQYLALTPPVAVAALEALTLPAPPNIGDGIWAPPGADLALSAADGVLLVLSGLFGAWLVFGATEFSRNLRVHYVGVGRRRTST